MKGMASVHWSSLITYKIKIMKACMLAEQIHLERARQTLNSQKKKNSCTEPLSKQQIPLNLN